MFANTDAAVQAAFGPDAPSGTYTIGGEPITYTSPTESTTVNKKIDDHVTPGDEYLVQVHNMVSGYKVVSNDQNNLGTINAKMMSSGDYSYKQVDKDGNVNEVAHKGHKVASDNHTHTVGGNADHNYDGGHQYQTGKGKHEVHADAATTTTQGAVIHGSESSAKTYTSGGDGHHVMKGDQSFVVDEGGIHYDVASGYTITALDSIQLDTSKELSLKVGGNMGVTALNGKISVLASGDINISSDVNITLAVGSSSITITPSSITIQASAINFVKS